MSTGGIFEMIAPSWAEIIDMTCRRVGYDLRKVHEHINMIKKGECHVFVNDDETLISAIDKKYTAMWCNY